MIYTNSERRPLRVTTDTLRDGNGGHHGSVVGVKSADQVPPGDDGAAVADNTASTNRRPGAPPRAA